MTPPSPGRSLSLSPARLRTIDLLHEAHKVPLVAMEKRMALAPVVARRSACRPRPGWCAIFIKAYALVAARRSELRRAYMSFPRPRLFEHSTNVAAVTIERMIGDEPCVFLGRIAEPEKMTLHELDARLQHFKEAPLEQVDEYWLQLSTTRWPRFVRRLLWWAGLNVSGPVRAACFGTFAVTTTAGAGASANFFPSPLATALHYGLLQEDGGLDVRLMFDHRVMDGGPAARALVDLEKTLLNEIAAELAAGAHLRAA